MQRKFNLISLVESDSDGKDFSLTDEKVFLLTREKKSPSSSLNFAFCDSLLGKGFSWPFMKAAEYK
jgi:hypothetical protein